MAGKEITCAAAHKKGSKSCQWRGRGETRWDAGYSVINSFSFACGESQNTLLSLGCRYWLNHPLWKGGVWRETYSKVILLSDKLYQCLEVLKKLIDFIIEHFNTPPGKGLYTKVFYNCCKITCVKHRGLSFLIKLLLFLYQMLEAIEIKLVCICHFF